MRTASIIKELRTAAWLLTFKHLEALRANEIKSVCMECNKLISGHPMAGEVSHGLCEDCTETYFEKELAGIEERKLH